MPRSKKLTLSLYGISALDKAIVACQEYMRSEKEKIDSAKMCAMNIITKEEK